MKRVLVPSILFVAAAFGPVNAEAQSATGTTSVTATVLSAITVTGASALAFGNVAPTQTKTVGSDVASAGKFSLTGGSPGASVSVAFTLPADLGAGTTLSSWTGRHKATDDQATGATFTPSASAASYTLEATTGTYYFWLGATLATSGATTGAKTGTVTLTATYN